MKHSVNISVIVPVYNVENYISRCIKSIQEQTYKDFEVLIIDDESQDKSIEIVKKLIKNDPRFKIISQKNRGLGGARNTGIRKANGEYLFFLDSDDYIENDTFSSLINYIYKYEVDIVVFDYFRVDENGNKLFSPKFGQYILDKEDAFRKILSLKTSPQAWNKLYKRKLFIENNIVYPEKFLHEDIATTYKLFWKSKKVGYIGRGFYYWVIRGDSITQKITYKHINDVVKSLLNKKEFLNQYGIYDKFELEYIRGSIQMLNILLERSWNYSNVIGNYDLYHYAFKLIDLELILTKEQMYKLEKFDKNLYKKFIENFQKNELLYKKEEKVCDTYKKKLLLLRNQLEEITNLRTYIIVQKYYKIRDFLLPLGTKRRKIAKLLIGRKN